MFAVYRVLKNGQRRYVSRTVTHSEKLAQEIAEGLTRGEFTRPDGSTGKCKPYPHVAAPIGSK